MGWGEGLPLALSLGSTETRMTNSKRGEEENGGARQLPGGGVQRASQGLWGPLRAPLRAAGLGKSQPSLHPWAEAPHPRLSPVGPRKLGFQAWPRCQSSTSCPWAQNSWHLWELQAGPAGRPPAAPLGLYHSGAAPTRADTTARPSPAPATGLTRRSGTVVRVVSGRRARLACSLALSHLPGSRMSSRLHRSPSERTQCSPAYGAQVSVPWASGQRPSPLVAALAAIFLHSDPNSWLLWARLPRSHPRGRAPGWEAPHCRGQGPQRSGAPCAAEGRANPPLSRMG